jgi:hypothetical protein
MIKGMYSKLPQSVKIGKERFIINTDFRIFINFEEEMTQGIDTRKACNNALQNFYPAFSLIIQRNLLKEAVEKFIWFYKCGKEELPKKNKKGKSKEAFRYSSDDMYIWGAFKQYFNIDLSVSKLHWWRFRAMWVSLPSEAEFSKIKGYRVYDGKDKEILELQEYYKLPPNEKEIQDRIRLDKIYESLK